MEIIINSVFVGFVVVLLCFATFTLAKRTEFQEICCNLKISYHVAYFALALSLPKRDTQIKRYSENNFEMYGFMFLCMERATKTSQLVTAEIRLLKLG